MLKQQRIQQNIIHQNPAPYIPSLKEEALGGLVVKVKTINYPVDAANVKRKTEIYRSC